MRGVKALFPVGMSLKLSAEGRAETSRAKSLYTRARAQPRTVDPGWELLRQRTSDVIKLLGASVFPPEK